MLATSKQKLGGRLTSSIQLRREIFPNDSRCKGVNQWGDNFSPSTFNLDAVLYNLRNWRTFKRDGIITVKLRCTFSVTLSLHAASCLTINDVSSSSCFCRGRTGANHGSQVCKFNLLGLLKVNVWF